MNCREIQKKFSHFFDDLLSGKKNRVLFDHLSRCKTCQKAWDRFTGIFNSLRNLPGEDLPYDLVPGIMSRIEEMEQKEPWWQRLFPLEGFKPLVGAIVVAFVIVTFAITYRNFNVPQTPTKVTDVSERMGVADRVKRGMMKKATAPPGQFAASVAPAGERSYTVVTIYVDDVEQAERKISTLASRVLLNRNYHLDSGRCPQKVLTQFRIDIPATEVEFLLRELTKIGQVSHNTKPAILPGNKIHGYVGPSSRMVMKITDTGSTGSLTNRYPKKRKMGQNLQDNVPMIPVNVVVVSKGKR